MVEWGTVPLPDDPDLSPGQLEGLLARSHAGEPKEFRVSVDVLVNLAVTAGGVAVLMLATFVYAMRTRGARDHGHGFAARLAAGAGRDVRTRPR